MAIGGEQLAQVAQLLGGAGGPGRVTRRPAAEVAPVEVAPDADIDPDDSDDEAPAGAPVEAPAGDDEPAGDAGAHGDEPYTLKELSEKLEVPTKALYELQIPLGDGESVSLGELKDLAKNGRIASTELTELREGLTDRENELMRGRLVLSELAEAMGPALPPRAREIMEQRRAEVMKREQAATLRAIPGWANEKTYMADSQVMLDLFTQYGLKASDLEAVTKHQYVKMFYDYAKLVAKSKAVTVQATGAKGQITAPGAKRVQTLAGSLRATIEKAKRSDATKADRIAGIDALLKS